MVHESNRRRFIAFVGFMAAGFLGRTSAATAQQSRQWIEQCKSELRQQNYTSLDYEGYCRSIAERGNSDDQRWAAFDADAADRDRREKNFRANKGCFVTTACCGAVGLPDDCWELESLRRFRDEVLVTMPGGPADIAHYYIVAPTLCDRIAVDEGRDRALELYFYYILPCVLLYHAGLYSAVRTRYTQMLRSLQATYGQVVS
jgi:hypothetical protein